MKYPFLYTSFFASAVNRVKSMEKIRERFMQGSQDRRDMYEKSVKETFIGHEKWIIEVSDLDVLSK